MNSIFCLLFLSLFLILVGCDSSGDAGKADLPVTYAPAEEGQSPQGNEPTAGSGKVGPFEKKFDGVTFSVPAGWREVELTPQQQGFVDARFLVPSKETDLQLTCSSTGGGIDANVDRWIGQFQMSPDEKPQMESLKVGNVDAKWVELHGTFNSGMMSRERPRENWRMIGVGIPMGEHDFYLKLTGPSDAVVAIRDEFRNFVESGRIETQ